MTSDAPLLDHQVTGIEWLKQTPRALLADEPGLGKSRQLLTAATEPVLVVAPAMVLNAGTWDDEIEKWADGMDITQVPYSSTYVGAGGKVKRGDFKIPEVTLKPEYRERHWGTVICDESHYLKGRKTSWTHAIKQLDYDRMYQATGTPIPNWAEEAFTTLQFLYPEDARPGRRFGSYWRWAKEWFQVGPTRWADMAIGDPLDDTDEGWGRFRRENWGDRFLMRFRDDCLDLPPLTIQPWHVKMDREQGKVYRQLKRDFVSWLESGTEVTAWNSAAQTVKLLKAATGLEVLEKGAGHSAKLKALASILEDRPRQTLVVAHFRDSVEACARTAQEAGQKATFLHGGLNDGARTKAIRAFQRGEIDVLCASLDTVSEGMTLHQAGCDQIIRVEKSYRPSRNEQVVRRLHRIGQERPVICIDLLTEGTIDLVKERMLEEKTDQQMRALGRTQLIELAKAA